MPIYSFKCQECGTLVDHHLAFDDPLPACKCGGGLAKVFQLAGVKFKGDGFYRTDNQVNKPKED